MNILEENNSYLGYLETLSSMQAGRAEKLLAKDTIYFRKRVEKRDFILSLVKDGFLPKELDGEYCLVGIGVNYAVTKTEYDFASYIIDHNYTSDEAVERKIAEENMKKEEERLKEEKEMERKMEEATKRDAFEEWLNEKVANYQDEEKIKLMSEIFSDMFGNHNVNNKMIETLVLIENIDNPLCKEKLKKIVITSNPATMKVFTCLTGIKLPKSNKGISELIDSISSADFKDPIPYKKRKAKSEPKRETFWILKRTDYDKNEFMKVIGEPLNKYGLKLFIHSNGSLICISSADCGQKLVDGQTKTEVMNKLKTFVDKIGVDKIKELIVQSGEKNGWSPYSYQTTK